LKIDEIGEIAAYLKSNVKNYPPSIPALNLDFWLFLPTGEVMQLETWVISFDAREKDDDESVNRQSYFNMGHLLRSAIAAARVTPTFRYYVKNQNADNFVILYRVYEGDVDLSLLGNGAKSVQLGKFHSRFGTVQLDLHYRIDMVMSFDDAVTTEESNDAIQRGEVNLFRRPSVARVPPQEFSKEGISPCSPALANFSASPMSQEFPFGSQESHAKMGRSASSSESSTKMPRSDMRSSKSSNNSPQASSSFPQRNSCRRARLRNNSFPFASLLYDSQYSDDERLPKVDEDGDNVTNTTSLTKGASPGDKMSTLPTSPSAPGYIDEVTENMSIKESKSSASLTESKPQDESSTNEEQKKEPGSEDEMESSDDSYVKVFSFRNHDDLGEDLTEFVKEVRLAPTNLGSFPQSGSGTLNDELNAFKERAAEFDQFLARLKDNDDN